MNKKFVLAPDSFKESLSAKEVCQAMERGIKKVFPEAEIILAPMADGGEGTIEALIDATEGRRVFKNVRGPLENSEVEAYFGILGNSDTAVIEMAKASGLELLALKDRNPLITSTYGTGQLIKAAIDEGMHKIIIGIGGSATNDGVSGMERALGAKFLDEKGEEIPSGGGFLKKLNQIDMSNFDKRLQEVEIFIASDVTNPLVGKNGASYVFGPQKGASAKMVEELDENMNHYANIIYRDLGKDIKNKAGAGAAGGLGAGLLAFTDAEMKLGIELVANNIHLEDKIKEADYIFTGEGGMDYQTKFGKAPFGVSKLAKKYKKPCFALAGHIGEEIEVLYEEGMTAIFGIQGTAQTLPEALKSGTKNIERTSENIARILSITEY